VDDGGIQFVFHQTVASSASIEFVNMSRAGKYLALFYEAS
jgi:hypothetical protein